MSPKTRIFAGLFRSTPLVRAMRARTGKTGREHQFKPRYQCVHSPRSRAHRTGQRGTARSSNVGRRSYFGGVGSDFSISRAADDGRCRMPFDHGNEHQPAARFFDLRAADDLVGSVVAPFDEDVGTYRGDQLKRGVFVENGHGVDRLERAQDLGAGLRRVDRAAWTFQAAAVASEFSADDQVVSQVGGLAQQPHMAGVQEVEATVGEDDLLAGEPAAMDLGDQFFRSRLFDSSA